MKKHKRAFTVIESLVTLVIAALMLFALFGVYDRCRKVYNSITAKIESSLLPGDICQRIAEDIDRIAVPGSDAKMEISSSFAGGFPTSRLRISREFLDKKGKPEVLEEVIWQASIDLASKRMMLWRSHAGLIWEDRLLDEEERRDWTSSRRVFVPVCSGLTYFKVQVPKFPEYTPAGTSVYSNNTNANVQGYTAPRRGIRPSNNMQTLAMEGAQEEITYQDQWPGPGLPPAVTISVSFAEPVDSGEGGLEVPDELKTMRTIVTDHTKNITFQYVSPYDANDANSIKDANSTDRKRDGAAENDSATRQGGSTGTTPGMTNGSTDDTQNARPSFRSRRPKRR
ncbi:MAG: hypothetical protein A2178_00480 [Planctomycetes bacterium GWC2_49_10]|nr:MAG: hypothetical protein A2178_00480 [Planctomycetes bacterium GWC2_49_10]